eukprot:m.395525 g.395525  ORF g.395525 m.395525 type:complete len:158 (-) comp56394_c0_seq10:286-759(-)
MTASVLCGATATPSTLPLGSSASSRLVAMWWARRLPATSRPTLGSMFGDDRKSKTKILLLVPFSIGCQLCTQMNSLLKSHFDGHAYTEGPFRFAIAASSSLTGCLLFFSASASFCCCALSFAESSDSSGLGFRATVATWRSSSDAAFCVEPYFWACC